MEPATTIILVSCGVFFLIGLVTGIWKHSAMLTSPSHLAPAYVDTAHRAALLYSFAALVLMKFVEWSPFPAWVNAMAAAAPLLFFAVALARYISLGLRNETDNQYLQPDKAGQAVMAGFITAQVGGFGVLFLGYLLRRFAGW